MDKNLALTKTIVSLFRFNGLSIKGDACSYLTLQLTPIDISEQRIWLEKIIEYLQQKKALSNPIVEKSHVITAVEECCKLETITTDDIINIIDVFDVPEFQYSSDCKKFIPILKNNSFLFDLAESKIKKFNNRYMILKQRILRHELLSTGSAKDSMNRVQIHDIDSLLSCSSKNFNVVIFGLLSQLEEGKYYLEDTTGILPLDLSQAVYHNGLFTENCLILVEGNFSDGILHVQGVAMPPPESSHLSRTYFGDADTFGKHSNLPLKTSSRLLKMEKDNDEAMIVFLADIWLDDSKVVEKLKLLFAGYNEYSPIAIILMGNFLSKPYGNKHSHILREKFKELAEIIIQYSSLLRETLFIIVPGPTDSPFPNILPRPSLPSFIVEEFAKLIPKSVFGTNPCRIQYCTQEIIVFREDIFTKMCRNSIYFPEFGDVSVHFVKTILSQCYLVPVPLSICPVYWDKTSALTLYPLPDVLVIADQRTSFNINNNDCVIFNPSSFSSRKYCFKVYFPASKFVEDSQIVEEQQSPD